QGRPFIPGSSLKGALRSSVERRVEWLGLRACYLENGGCLVDVDDVWRRKPLQERVRDIEHNLCAVCKVFGSTVIGGKVRVDDLPLTELFEPLASSLTEVRDGVGIDRDSGTAVDTAKFDYEVIPSLTAFRFYLTAENLEQQDAALLALSLLEMMSGSVPLGGKSTRGLGRCRLHLEKAFYFDFPQGSPLDSELLLEYLKPLDARRQGRVENPRSFLEEQIRRFLEERNNA
ncbi:MAG: RAMP superfamily CRISPR-associated protein, partial [Nitrospira sp.]|nr:RAMP superfamily CRISPR-associated protein [Nitrospira sp.]